MATAKSRRKSGGGKKKKVPSSTPAVVPENTREGDIEVDVKEKVETIEIKSVDEEEKVVEHHHEDAISEEDDSDAKEVTRLALTRKIQSASEKPSVAGHSREIGNGLTELIPGYIAPLSLCTASLDNDNVDLSELRRRAERTDASTKNFMVPAQSNKLKTATTVVTNFLPTNFASYSFKMGKKRAPDLTAGAGWFKMMSSEITDEVKTDMALIRHRNYLDPKRFYKKTDKFGKHVQVGTVVEGSAEYYSSRLTKKERRSNLTDEIMADPESADYAKRKYKKMTHEKQATAEHFHKKKRKVTKSSMRGY